MTSAYWVLLLMICPVAVWAYCWARHKSVVIWEAVLGVLAALVLSSAVFGISGCTAAQDKEIWSGYALQAFHTPWWRAEWTEIETTTDDEGNTETNVVTKSETHQPKWWLETTIGDVSISRDTFDEIRGRYGGYEQAGDRPDFDEGDRFDYFSNPIPMDDPSRPPYPVHASVEWANPLLGTDSILLGRTINQEEANARNLFPYLISGNRLSSARVMGGSAVTTYRWDQMCASLGASKKVNLVLLNFGDRPMDDAVLQRDYWRNGRKNELVLCYGHGWAYVFGWAKSDLVKQELQALLLKYPVNDATVPRIEKIVRRDFEPYPWKLHDGTPRPVSGWAIFTAFVLMVATQVSLFFLVHGDEFEK